MAQDTNSLLLLLLQYEFSRQTEGSFGIGVLDGGEWECCLGG